MAESGATRTTLLPPFRDKLIAGTMSESVDHRGEWGEVRMNRARFGGLVCIAAFVAATIRLSGPTVAQDGGDAEATIAALQTEVADLQTQVAALTTPTVPASSHPGTPGAESPLSEDGDALPLLPPGEPGIVDIVAVGSPVRGTVPIAVRNNTGTDVLLNGVLGIARDQSGALAFSGDVSTVAPFVLSAGQVAIGDVYFGPSDLPGGLTFEFEPESSPVGGGNAFRQDLEIVEATRKPEGIVGIARNPTDQMLNGPFSVIGVCFDQSGAIQGYYAAYAAKNELAPGDSTQFTATFYGSGPCDAHLLGSTGHKA